METLKLECVSSHSHCWKATIENVLNYGGNVKHIVQLFDWTEV